MATSNLTFQDWQQKTNASLMSAAEELLEKLEDTSDLLTEIDERYILSDKNDGIADDNKTSMMQRFHAGLDSARNLVNVLKREKCRLSKREMSVALRMGELEEYKSHLKNDMSSLNQTVDVLSLRVVQLENQLADAQETQENLEAELEEHRNSLHDANDRNIHLFTENEDLKKKLNEASKSNLQKANTMLQDEVCLLRDENSKIKEMVRDLEANGSAAPAKHTTTTTSTTTTATAAANANHASPNPVRPPRHKDKDDNLSKLTKEFLDELSSLELRERKAKAAASAAATTTTTASTAGDSPAPQNQTIHLKTDDV